MITYDSLFKENREEENMNEFTSLMHEAVNGLSDAKLREVLLETSMKSHIEIRDSDCNEDEKMEAIKQNRDYAIVARRCSDTDIRKMSEIMVDRGDLDGFIDSRLPELTVDEPGNMDTMENMEKILQVVTARYKKYVETGELDPLLEELTLDKLTRLVMLTDCDMEDDAARMFNILSIAFYSVVFPDESLMHYTAPDDIAQQFVLRSAEMVADVGVPKGIIEAMRESKKRMGWD